MNNILILNGHPNRLSFCHELAKRYDIGAKHSGATTKLINLVDLDFSPILQYGYTKMTELESDLINIQKEIQNTDHLVFVYPNWWGTYPALLKGFFDRVFLPKFAFKYRENSLRWDKLLSNKTARLIVTMDTPKWYYSLVYKKPGHNSVKKSILQFCGVKPIKITSYGPIKTADNQKLKKWLHKAELIGNKDGK